MKREWKPGDVAIYDGHIAFVWDDDDYDLRDGRLSFVYTDADGDPCSVYVDGTNARPLVAIDAEDREQVERLLDLFSRQPLGAYGQVTATDRMQAALREFANPKPPKPDEPTGLGAVVEDDKGGLWVRVEDERHSWVKAHRDPVAYTQRAKWESINAVRVLSEGVS